jgi:hypothetical protein
MLIKYLSTPNYVPEDLNLQQRRCENFSLANRHVFSRKFDMRSQAVCSDSVCASGCDIVTIDCKQYEHINAYRKHLKMLRLYKI